jgi:bifunctional non-homologous end joining protein LigD
MIPAWHPMPLLRVKEPFDHPDWLFELKHDGFRALAIVEGHHCQLVSRRGHVFRQWPQLAEELAHTVKANRAVLDGELVCLRPDGVSDFYSLLYRREWPVFVAFDLLQLDGADLRGESLLERKRRLRALVPRERSRLRYLDHVRNRGRDLFAAACAWDTEGIVAKWGAGPYRTDGALTSWVKVRNPNYSQMAGRHEAFLTRGDGKPRRTAPPYRMDPAAARAW